MDIAIPVYCKKHRKTETVYINRTDDGDFPNVCEVGDGSAECLECLRIAVEQYFKSFTN